jgi:hypothetical protein
LSATTGIDVNVLLNTILGGAITISGSLAVAALYIRNQNKVQRKRNLRETLQRDYFDNCINPTLGALSEYGMNAAFALLDSSMLLGRYVQFKNVTTEELERKLKEISNRPLVMDLTSHNFSNISKYRPLLQKFGTQLQSSIIRSLQFYSSVVDDGTSYTVLKKSSDSSSLQEVSRSLGIIALIIERTLIYLEKRFINLRDYFLAKELENYDDFSKVFLEKDYAAFLSIIEQYMDGLTKLMEALKDPKGDRANVSLVFSKWLTDNMENNPLNKKTETKKYQKTEPEILSKKSTK